MTMTAPTKKKHVLLVVDDEADLVDSIQHLLRREYHVLGATRAAEGLKIVEREPVQIVMTDQCMPEMTGVEFLRRLRETHPDTVRLLFTAYADIKAVIDAINQGNVYRYITKPLQPEDLLAVLKQAAEYYDLLAERKCLLQELQQKNQNLEAANAELKQANELKKAFIKVASHELRTPLTIVLGLADLACMTPGVPPQVQNWLERILGASKRLNDRVDQMVKLLQADRYDRPLQRRAILVPELLEGVAADVGTFIDARQQHLQVSIAPELTTWPMDGEKIRDCLLQLLVNAIKFTPDGGTIRLSAMSTPQGWLMIQVRDTGVGMDAAACAHVFDPFFTRFDVSTHTSGVFEFDRRGLGLGLAMVKAFVEMHGGRVQVESEIGKGSTFTILLPP